MKLYSYKKGGGKDFSHAEEGHNTFWGSFMQYFEVLAIFFFFFFFFFCSAFYQPRFSFTSLVFHLCTGEHRALN